MAQMKLMRFWNW